ncbi:MAG: DUF444 family protein [Chitinispirillaceae bacterium]
MIMDEKHTRLEKQFEELKRKGLSADQEKRIRQELDGPVEHQEPDQKIPAGDTFCIEPSIYNYADMVSLQFSKASQSPHLGLSTLDELLERDRQREKDGFPRKIRIGRLIRPGREEKNAIVIVPTTVEEKFIHDAIRDPSQDGQAGGSGDGAEGEVIGEQPVRPQQGEGTGAGEGGDSSHEMESSAYDLGKILTEKFELPNLQDRGNKRSLTKYTYDITDKNRGFGQVLDKKATLRKVLETNFNLGKIPDVNNIDTTDMIISPRDKIYRILSREKDYESQAVVFFVRDYSGSMAGKCTELVVSQHVMIYSWLLYQYAKRIQTRFILHDTDAREVSDFYTYYNSKVAGGTQVSSAYHLVNEIVEKENLAQDYNIYVFHGTDGDDWDSRGDKSIPELRRIMQYANRIGVSIVEHSYGGGQKTEVQRYLEKSGMLVKHADLLRMDVMDENADEKRLIEGIRKLISEEIIA